MKNIEEKNILIGNQLIAEFMGFERLESYKIWFDNKGKEVHQLEFHISWDWLMPVVEKIKKMPFYKKEAMDRIDNILTCNLRINYLYDEVVQFIEWYNNFLDIEDQIASDMDRD